MRRLSALILAGVLTLVAPAMLAGPARAHDDGRHAHRHGHDTHRFHDGRYKYEYDDGICKVEIKRGRHGYKEERKCRYDRRGHRYDGYHGRSRYRDRGHDHRDYGWRPHGRYHRPFGDLHSRFRRPPPAYGGALFLEGRGLTCNREIVGQVIGGAVGALAGSNIGSGSGQLYAIAGGALLGVLAGGEVGRFMDLADHGCVYETLEYVPSGRSVTWVDPDAGTYYEAMPTRTYRAESGRYCREYTTTATVGGRRQQIYGTACRQPDGSWELVD